MSDPSPPEPLLPRLLGALDRRATAAIRGARARRAPAVASEALVLHSTAGYKLEVWVHTLPAAGPAARPAVVLCPGIDDGADVFLGQRAPVSADEVARLGYVVLRFNPAGRGESWGEEDFGGPEHQDDVARMVAYLRGRPDVDPARVGILSISLGLSMAVGAVVRAGAKAAWILDWEGPSDREVITSGGQQLTPANGHTMHDEVYWRPREAVRHVGKLDCGYIRLQAEHDHAQPGEVRHATRMVTAAAEGQLPWFQINDHPRGEAPPRPVWMNNGALAANRSILRKLQTLREERRRNDL